MPPRSESSCQDPTLHGGGGTPTSALLWVLPNPSGLNAHYQPAELVALFRALREAVR